MMCGMEDLTSVLHVFILRVIWSVKQMNYPRKRSPMLPEKWFHRRSFFRFVNSRGSGREAAAPDFGFSLIWCILC